MPENFEGKNKEENLPQQSETPEEFLARAERELMDKAKETTENIKNKDEFIQVFEKEGIDLNKPENLGGVGGVVASGINVLFERKYRVSVSEDKLPIVIVPDTDIEKTIIGDINVPFSLKVPTEKGRAVSTIHMRGLNDILNGNYFCEEMAHFYRDYFKVDKNQEEITGEFFGFLGKKMWQKAVKDGDAKDLKFLVDIKEQKVDSKKKALKMLKELKAKIESEKDGTARERLEQERKDILIHQRGYEYADKVDLDKIKDWKKLFSMPDAEVRKRFFTNKPDYSDL
jgi:hypothetical protein